MYTPPFFSMNQDEISVEQNISTTISVMDGDDLTLSITNGISMENEATPDSILSMSQVEVSTPHDAAVIKEQEKAADQSVCLMIKELISCMHTPLIIQNNTEQNTVGTQAGFSCFICDLSFVTSTGLFRHNRIRHSFFPFTCVHCNVGYARICGLTKHLKLAHQIVVKKVK